MELSQKRLQKCNDKITIKLEQFNRFHDSIAKEHVQNLRQSIVDIRELRSQMHLQNNELEAACYILSNKHKDTVLTPPEDT